MRYKLLCPTAQIFNIFLYNKWKLVNFHALFFLIYKELSVYTNTEAILIFS